MPILLGTYWTLAAGAAAFALLPVDLAPGVRNAVQLSAARGKLSGRIVIQARHKSSYYVVLPLSCLPMASFGDWKYISDRQPGSISMWTMLGLIALKPRHQLGVCMFLAGNALQGWSHCILASLRHTTAQTVIKERDFYQVPQGGPFHWVSCPHYLGEIVIYAGLALLAGQELPLTLLVLCWVVANLLLAAQPTHQWYQRQFPDYPKNRTALIPYLY
ncbi:hypothetical protein WJX77_004147 [Trebouxia sp. C0004]